MANLDLGIIFGLRLLVTPVKREELAERPEGLAEELAGFCKFVERHRRDDEHLTFFYSLDPARANPLFIVEETTHLVEQGSM
jgi:hypothetical protein